MKPILTISLILFTIALQAQSIDSTQVNNAIADSLNITVMDSTQIAEQTKATLNEELDITLTTDSTELVNQAKQRLKEQINKEGIELPTDSTQATNKAKTLVKDNIDADIDVPTIPTDSAALKQEVKSIAQKQLSEQTNLNVPDITIDSTLIDQVESKVEARAKEFLPDAQQPDILDDEIPINNVGEVFSANNLKQQAAQQAMKQKMTMHAKNFVTEHAEQIQQMQSQMGDLKRVYSSVPNSNDLSTATKRSSLKDQPLKKRLTFGTNFNISGTNPLSIDLSPTLGYKFNKLFEMGITGAYRAQFGEENITTNTAADNQVYGYSIYANHDLFKNFFGYIEGENMNILVGADENKQRIWKQNLLAGIGRSFKITKGVEVQAMILYNFLHDNTENVYNSPVVFKTGVRVNR